MGESVECGPGSPGLYCSSAVNETSVEHQVAIRRLNPARCQGGVHGDQ